MRRRAPVSEALYGAVPVRVSLFRIFGIVGLLVGATTASGAAQLSRAVAVTVQLQGSAAGPKTGSCGTVVVPGPITKVWCTLQSALAVSRPAEGTAEVSNTGEGMADVSHTGEGFIVQVVKSGQLIGSVETYTGGSMVTSWRVVSLPSREYLEMTVAW